MRCVALHVVPYVVGLEDGVGAWPLLRKVGSSKEHVIGKGDDLKVEARATLGSGR